MTIISSELLETIVALLTGRGGGQSLNGGTLTTQTLDLLNNAVDQLGIHINGDGSINMDRGLDVGQSGTAGIVEVKDASDVVRVKLNGSDGSSTLEKILLSGGIQEIQTTTGIMRFRTTSGNQEFIVDGSFDIDSDDNITFDTSNGNITLITQDGVINLNGSQKVSTKIVNAATYNLLITDYHLQVNYTATGVVTITLPTAQATEGRTINIYDSGYNAATNNITVETGGSETIRNASNLIIVGNGDSATLRYNATNTDWEII